LTHWHIIFLSWREWHTIRMKLSTNGLH